MTRWIATACCLLAMLTAHADPLEDLRSAITERLLLMEGVARYKWNHGLPVTDPTREAALLTAKLPRATSLGLPAVYAQRVLEAQLSASRLLQISLTAQWAAQHRGAFADVPDLATAQRPLIDAATDHLIERLRDAVCALAEADARDRMSVAPEALGAYPDAWSTATDTLWPVPEAVDCPDGQ